MKVGQVVEVRFWDHSMNAEPVECVVWGRVSYKDRLHVKVVMWECTDPAQKDGNEEHVSVLNSAIIEKRVLAS